MKILAPVAVSILLAALPLGGMQMGNMHMLLGVAIPYFTFALFVLGFMVRIARWIRTPVPFNITTTAGQQKTLPWIKPNPVENPSNYLGVILRMAGEVFLFRSLFRNSRSFLSGGRLIAQSDKWLWSAGIVFHYTMFIIVLRHIRFFNEVPPLPIRLIDMTDSMFQVGVPALYLTGVGFMAAVGFLFLRRLTGQMRVLSTAADYFPLALFLLIGLTGAAMRYLAHVDIPAIKAHMMSLVHLAPATQKLDDLFYVHIFLVSVFMAYFPMSKLVHAGGIFFSPTRNMPNNSRIRRHINPWDYPVPPHSYEHYEDDFREKMIEAGLPVDRTTSSGKESH